MIIKREDTKRLVNINNIFLAMGFFLAFANCIYYRFVVELNEVISKCSIALKNAYNLSFTGMVWEVIE